MKDQVNDGGPAHLWEVDHSYYCNLNNYFNNDCGSHFKRWSDFIEAMGDADMDYNLLFRWDWVEGEDEGAKAFDGDPNYRNGELRLFWMGQRKGLYQFSTVEVCRADEPAVIEYLRPRLAYLMALWAPLTESARGAQ